MRKPFGLREDAIDATEKVGFSFAGIIELGLIYTLSELTTSRPFAVDMYYAACGVVGFYSALMGIESVKFLANRKRLKDEYSSLDDLIKS